MIQNAHQLQKTLDTSRRGFGVILVFGIIRDHGLVERLIRLTVEWMRGLGKPNPVGLDRVGFRKKRKAVKTEEG